MGKATPFFQNYLQEPDQKRKYKLRSQAETNHAHLSSLFAYKQLKNRFEAADSPISSIIPLIGYEVVRRHHGNLGNMREEVRGQGDADRRKNTEVFGRQIQVTCISNLVELYEGVFPREEIIEFHENYVKIYEEIRKSESIFRKTREYGLESSVLTLFCFSVLVSADKEDASGLSITRKPELLKQDLIEEYRKQLGYDNPTSDLNKVREKIYSNASDKASTINLNERILSLNMPTGSGKTLTGLNFALRLRERLKREKNVAARIIYSVSFISIIDQNSRVFEEAYKTVTGEHPKSEIMLKHHHLADILYDSEEDENDYDALESKFFVEGWNSEMVFTTFVQFFHSILTNRNRALRKLHRIANSIVLLDEVQSIPYSYWSLLRNYLRVFGEFFNTYFVFMTATLPYIFDEGEITEIVDDSEQYYGFFDRVDLYPRLEEMSIEDYMEEVVKMVKSRPDQRYLLIHNTVRSSQMVYRFLREKLPRARLLYLSTMVTPKERLRRIDEVRKDSGPVVVVSTQLVEAGVDIDMDVVYRDMAPLDSVIQAAGRCNRNFKKERGRVHLLKLLSDNKPFYSRIYGATSILVTRTSDVLDKLCIIPEKSFRGLVTRFYEKVRRGMSENKSDEILSYLAKMELDKLSSFKLIEDDYPKIDVFIEDGLEAGELWRRFTEVKEIKDREERRRCFMVIKKDFLENVISVPLAYRNKVGWSEEYEMGYVTKNEGLYDLELGFIRDEQTEPTFFI